MRKLLLCALLAACGGDKVVSLQPVKAVCSSYKDCWAYGETPEGCCVDPHNAYAWICVDVQTDKLHCGDCDTSCPGVCCRGACSDGTCQQGDTMTLLEFVTALGPSGLGVGLLSFGGLVLKMTAWRLRARDLREHQARLASATTAEQRALIASVPPPDFGDQVLKVLVVALLSGMALACSEPAYRLATIARLGPASLCRPACQRGERCIGRTCTMDARPTVSDIMTSTAPHEPPSPSPTKPPVGPQSLLDAVLASRRWTDGHDPFELAPAL